MDKHQVLILCTGNSCRSQMAEAIINAQRGETWLAFSAGTSPAEAVHPYALQALSEIGIPHEGAYPKSVQVFLKQPFDLVITVCDDVAENCPVWFGQGKRVHIGFPDPAQASGTADEVMPVFRAVRDDIIRRILPALDNEE